MAELGKNRDAGSCPADFRRGDEEDHLHHSSWVPTSGQPGASDALLAAVGVTGPPGCQAEEPGSENQSSHGSSNPRSDTGGIEPDAGNVEAQQRPTEQILRQI